MDEDREQRKIKKVTEIDLISPTRELRSLTLGLTVHGRLTFISMGDYAGSRVQRGKE